MKKLFRSLLAAMLITMMAISFTSCGAKPKKIEEKLKDRGYTVKLIDDKGDIEEISDDFGGISTVIVALSKSGEVVYVYWFEKKADAKDAAKKLEVVVGSGYKLAKRGKILVLGTGNAFDEIAEIIKAKQ